MLMETVGSKSITAHILGGAVMGTSAEQGVIDPQHGCSVTPASTSWTPPRSRQTWG